ncbi:type III effector [Polaribacter reichenbachii]|uniref:Type III effector n=1 Tax=Polaribacter reichenbachii TaxID=996801 RepID=A0A1B8TYI9_9FLAO|nr:HopJ type III effector protein [Polaribacter reichenbachii]APZ45891.1 type III effector [Polaribacter reichenbachii]AUC19753.1 type III effector [Polaribacter reichenbachii]OBY64678.1 type III effector [Polaribacter reichenbachii]
MTIQEFKKKLKENPNSILFADTIQVIEDNYNFTPTAFINGTIKNKAGENSGSCKLFTFATHQQLTKEDALACFGEHYQNVLEDENGTSHQNIRNFMKTGFSGLSFNGDALELK